MATNLISFPFRLAPSGSVVTTADGTDERYAEEISTLILTRRGERPLVPAFGIDDPVFAGVDEHDLGLAVQTFGPPVVITAVTTKQVDDSRQTVVVSWDRADVVPTAGQRINVSDLGVL